MLQWLPWQDAAGLAGGTAVTWAIASRSTRGWSRRVRPWARELTVVLVLYGMWQYAGAWSLARASEAAARGRAIWDLERVVRLPSERAVQGAVLHHQALLHWLNEYYVWLHAPALGACLVWLFVAHRDRYAKARTVTAVVTGTSLLVQMVPIAPPRLLAGLGVVDTGVVVGPSDYSGPGSAGVDQLSAMPSLHVAWAIVVAGAVVWASRRRRRWAALAYPVLTVFVVVATGNHYWADALAAAALCALATVVVARVYAPAPPSAPPEAAGSETTSPAPSSEPTPVQAGSVGRGPTVDVGV